MTAEPRSRPLAGPPPGLLAGGRLGALPSLVAPGVVFLAGQGLTLLTLESVARRSGWRLWQLLGSWDAEHLLALAQSGYPGAGPGSESQYAFFPGLPLLVRCLAAITGADVQVCGVAASVAAGVVLAYGVDRLAAQILPDGRGAAARLSAVFLVAVLPLSVVFVMPYTEALFCALAVWALVLLGRRRWVAAGVCACLAGLVRPTAAPLWLALVVSAAAAWRRGEPHLLRALAGCALAPLGTLGYVVWAGWSSGRPRAWSDAESKGWGATVDFGAYTWSWLRRIPDVGLGLMGVAVVVGTVACLLAIAMLLRARAPARAAYVTGVLVLALGTSTLWNSKYRLLLPALVVVAVLVAGELARCRPIVRLTVLVLAAGIGCSFSAVALTVYPYAI